MRSQLYRVRVSFFAYCHDVSGIITMGIVTMVLMALESIKGNSSRILILIKKWGGKSKGFFFLFFA